MSETTQVKKSVHPLLKEYGFVNKSLVWNRNVNGMVHVIGFQLDKQSIDSCLRFTINIGICCPRVRYLTWGDSEPDFYDDTDCCPRFRVGYLIAGGKSNYLDKWWIVREGDDSELEEVVCVLKNQCMSWFECHSTLPEMYRLASAIKPRMQIADKIYLAVTAHILGHFNERDSIFGELLSSRSLSWLKRIEQVLERLGLSVGDIAKRCG